MIKDDKSVGSKDWKCLYFAAKLNWNLKSLLKSKKALSSFLWIVNKMSPRPSLIPDTSYEPTMTQPMTQSSPPENIEKPTEASNQEKNEPNKSTNRARESSCR